MHFEPTTTVPTSAHKGLAHHIVVHHHHAIHWVLTGLLVATIVAMFVVLFVNDRRDRTSRSDP